MTLVALSKSYAAVFGAPVLHAVDPTIFSHRYFTRCMSCNFCHDACCSYGVDIDVDNMARLKALGPAFEQAVGVARDAWFEAAIESDAEFPGGANGRTRVHDGACVFLDRAKRGCKIHSYCLANGIDYHLLKPMVSVLFPLTFANGVLCPSDEIIGGELVCMNQGLCLFDGLRGELEHYFGAEFVRDVDRIRAGLAWSSL